MAKKNKGQKKKQDSGKPEGLDYSQIKHLNATQQNLEIDRIREGVLVLKHGGLRIILMVSAVNFALKNQEEQNAIVAGYQNFLNSLTFPLQIVAQSRRLDLTTYLKDLEARTERQPNELLRIQMVDYVGFVRRLLSVANIMDKNFYVIVPYEPIAQRPSSALDKIRGMLIKQPAGVKIPDWDAAKKELRQRADLVASSLGSLGLRAVQLNTQELIELLYTSYNATSVQFQQVASPEDLMQPVIEGKETLTEKKEEK